MSLLSIGKSGLFAAQAALATTGNNITNANVAGYSRETVVQQTSTSMASAGGYIGTGTEVAQVKRYSDDFLNAQVRTAQATDSGLQAYESQITQVDNLMSDTTSGLSPALQDFFSSVQNLTGNSADDPSRQALLSSADTLTARFQSMNDRLNEIREGVNTQISSGITQINTYASQIAALNDQITKLSGDGTNKPNELMDQRDQLVMQLNQQVKATVVQGDNNTVTVSIGSGQPLVVGSQAFQLAATTSPTDQTRVEVGYVTGSKTTPIAESSLQGGAMGAALDFRANSLDPAQNAFGQIAIGLAQTFNAQQELGLDANGSPGSAFFTIPDAEVTKNVNNNITTTTDISVKVSDATQLTASDYTVSYDGSNYNVTRLSDNKKTAISPFPQTTPQTIDGLEFAITGNAAAGDNFLVRPTVNGANINVALTDPSEVAAAAPIATSVPLSNSGTAKISAGTVDKDYLAAPLTGPVTLSYDSASKTLSGFPATQGVTMTAMDGTTTTYPAGSKVPYADGASYAVGGMHFTLTGAPGNGDSFTIANNTGLGDTRNAGLLGDLQSKNVLNNGTATYQSAFAGLVGTVGNKTNEVQVNQQASAAQLQQAQSSADNVSGVNLDEEASNLLKYQQAYQAASKVMQIADTVFQSLLQISQ